MRFRTTRLLGAAALLPAFGACAGQLRVGQYNEAVIEPAVPHPDETPCTVPLIQNVQFENFNPVNYSYTPPASCPPPWARVVLAVDLSVSAGVQFDRSGLLFMAGVPLWFGTTAEPRTHLAPSWSFTKDVTDYTALFTQPQSGQVNIGNLVNSQYTGIITSTMELRFYPVTKLWPAPQTADVVLPLPGTGGAGSLSDPTQTISISQNFPTNVLAAKLDLYLQGQGGDEFWYTCVPNDLTTTLQSCGGGALREGEVTVDSMPAGVAPVYPWIFTGGIDPNLWAPIPGVQTLDFTPFTVDLSPFAGVLSNGAVHTIAASVYGDNNYFQATGALRLFLDHGTAQVTGAVKSDTLAAMPTVTTIPNVTTGGTATTGTVQTSDERNFTIIGTVSGSAGTTVYTVQQNSHFANNQQFRIAGHDYVQDIAQETKISEVSTSSLNGAQSVTSETLSWPLHVNIDLATSAKGNYGQTTSIMQEYAASGSAQPAGGVAATTSVDDKITTGDQLLFNGSFQIIGNDNQSESAAYSQYIGSSCFMRSLTAANSALTSVSTGCAP